MDNEDKEYIYILGPEGGNWIGGNDVHAFKSVEAAFNYAREQLGDFYETDLEGNRIAGEWYVKAKPKDYNKYSWGYFYLIVRLEIRG